MFFFALPMTFGALVLAGGLVVSSGIIILLGLACIALSLMLLVASHIDEHKALAEPHTQPRRFAQ